MRENKNRPEQRREENQLVYYDRGEMDVDGKKYSRYAIQTHFIQLGEDYIELVKRYAAPLYREGDVLSLGAKVIAMCQRHIMDDKTARPGFWAKILYRVASKNQSGYGLHEPHKMQAAINIAGLPRILLAAFCAAVTKPFGIKGVFYRVAGNGVNGIDGFNDKSNFPIYHKIAVMNPKDPFGVCREVKKETGMECMVMDANDLDNELLGYSDGVGMSERELRLAVKDNPSGQEDELTPFILIRPAEGVS